jgi:hypothetical protein
MAFRLLMRQTQEVDVTKRTYGILAGVIGFGAWWWNRRRQTGRGTSSADRGTRIYSNTPTAPEPSDAGII